ncbi:MAG: biotin carboxylase N-terminal domain-containing protein, partial [Myxococcota bacterium]|nr:biotin carboxylase N-terminal domain-containing protein [Myxococcota bacterium]
MFRRILVANRGEVAARVLRTCRRLGIGTVAVASRADSELSYLSGADEVVVLESNRCYLDIDGLITLGLRTGCSAVHPGWGFLSENPTFAACCEAARMTFLGPSSATMRRMSDKAEARATMAALGLEPVPGSKGVVQEMPALAQRARELGFPVLLKALSGGGGRGMRRVDDEAGLVGAFTEATAEAAGAFADGRLYLEKWVRPAHHVEFQVLGDGRDVMVLGARECSVQRRHQKLVEESPSPFVGPE